MRVLQLTKHYPPYFGGIESVTFDLTEGLNKRGIHCDVLCANDHFKNIETKFEDYTVWRRKSLGKLMSTTISPSIITKLSQLVKQYDIIHAHFPDPMNALALYLAQPKAKLVIHWHSDIIKQKKVLKFFLPLQNKILSKADAIVGTSQTYIESSEQLNKFIHKTTSIPIGIPDKKLTSEPGGVEEIKEKYREKKIIFSLGRLIYYKGFTHLINAARYTNEDSIILIAGKGQLESELREQIMREGLQDKVQLLGGIAQDKLGNYFAAADIFCLPSMERSEAFGVVLLEAMQFGKPIVTTNIPGSGVPWVNQDGVTGFNVKICDPLALAESINNILNDSSLSSIQSKNARERFLQHFTDDKMIDNFVKLYHKLLEK